MTEYRVILLTANFSICVANFTMPFVTVLQPDCIPGGPTVVEFMCTTIGSASVQVAATITIKSGPRSYAFIYITWNIEKKLFYTYKMEHITAGPTVQDGFSNSLLGLVPSPRDAKVSLFSIDVS